MSEMHITFEAVFTDKKLFSSYEDFLGGCVGDDVHEDDDYDEVCDELYLEELDAFYPRIRGRLIAPITYDPELFIDRLVSHSKYCYCEVINDQVGEEEVCAFADGKPVKEKDIERTLALIQGTSNKGSSPRELLEGVWIFSDGGANFTLWFEENRFHFELSYDFRDDRTTESGSFQVGEQPIELDGDTHGDSPGYVVHAIPLDLHYELESGETQTVYTSLMFNKSASRLYVDGFGSPNSKPAYLDYQLDGSSPEKRIPVKEMEETEYKRSSQPYKSR